MLFAAFYLRKLRQDKHNVVHALKFVNASGLLPMTTASSKLVGSESASGSGSMPRSRSHGSTPKKGNRSAGSTGDSGTGGDSLSSGKKENHPLTRESHSRGAGDVPWYSRTSGVINPAFKDDSLSGLKELGMISSPPAYLSAGYDGKDTQDLEVHFPAQNV